MTNQLFFLQAFGFFLQTFPVAILSFAPFSQNELRYDRKKIYSSLLVCLLLISSVFAALCEAIGAFFGSRWLLSICSDCYMGLLILVYVALFSYIIRVEFIKKALVLILLLHYAAIMFTMASFQGRMKTPDSIGFHLIIYDRTDILVYFSLALLTSPLVYLFLRRVVRPSLPVMEHRVLRRGCLYLFGSFILFSICVFTLTTFPLFYGREGFLTLLFLLAFILTDIIVYLIFFTEVHLSAANQELEDQLRSFDAYYREINTGIQEARRARHDLHHHINIISTLYHQGKDDELRDYLSQYENFMRDLTDLPLSGYPTMDNVLNFYIQKAREEGFSVDVDIQPFHKSPQFDIVDLTVLIGNIMENAMEACRRLPPPHRSKSYIRIRIRLSESVLLLKIENSCSHDVAETQGYTNGSEFISPKRRPFHGQGLKSIRYISEKYRGSAEFKQKDGSFAVRIVLNLP